ncbi:hypothetical protein [Lactobacillus crispatus]|jgi:hypothetical protein|uniref:DUF4263 domain-containing protein n=1 Tax=Lactobacillus crispatus TaxID=47770 RepID=A0AAW8WPC6_9LACO|nr:hypothetical protein [Lactobacillus crispatus]STX18333.1 Uncharacterised protein [Lactobacillus acidophilus]MCT7696869.1 hypothetical protein [Lactobacillus crispatus]MCT7708344.1 hypothetical protein [Lactobacillus crispatus]MCT7730899.1 hypothetical protein [Lactobacillus crispatus]MCT7802092.1 hypothetical protein [Lactobacillus crispatus]
MISGRHFNNHEIGELEAKYLNDFYTASIPDPILADASEYYSIIFQTFLHRNKDKVFDQMSEEEQKRIYKSQDTKFRNAMQYSFNKGHQTGFALLLMDSKGSTEFDTSFFKNPNAKLAFIYNLDKMISPKVTEQNLRRDKNEILIRETRRHFENGYDEIMYLAKLFYKKGAEVAFEQIRQNIVKANYLIKGNSVLLHVPYNQDFDVTPGFTATFAMESPNYEEWELHWNATYGYQIAKKLIGKFLIHQLSIKEIKAFSSVGAITYKMLDSYFSSSNLNDNDIVYLGEINFSLITPFEGMRTIEASEFSAIRTSLALTLQRRLNISNQNILVAQ